MRSMVSSIVEDAAIGGLKKLAVSSVGFWSYYHCSFLSHLITCDMYGGLVWIR
jgi:hypothetical protein